VQAGLLLRRFHAQPERYALLRATKPRRHPQPLGCVERRELQLIASLRDADDRLVQFENAIKEAESLADDEPALFDSDVETDIRFATPLYYCAKAAWSLVFAGGTITLRQKEVAQKAAQRALTLVERRVLQGIEDEYSSAIHRASLAYLMIAMKHSFLGDGIRVLPKNIRGHLDQAAQLARLGRNLAAGEFNVHQGIHIYNDHLERLDTAAEFERYINTLRTFVSDRNKIIAFYTKWRAPENSP